MNMTRKKASGFFIVEILIVLVIVGILVAALLPNLQTYTQRAKFVDVLNAVGAIKPAVELCILNQGGVATNCTTAAGNGIPASVAQGNSTSTVVTSTSATTVVITGTAITGGGFAGETYILTGVVTGAVPNQYIVWTASGSCGAAGLC